MTCVVDVVVPGIPITYVVELEWNVVWDEYGEVKADELVISYVWLDSEDPDLLFIAEDMALELELKVDVLVDTK